MIYTSAFHETNIQQLSPKASHNHFFIFFYTEVTEQNLVESSYSMELLPHSKPEMHHCYYITDDKVMQTKNFSK